MPKTTPNVGLYKVDGATDGNDTFNIDLALNENWDKIDAAIGEVREDLGDVTVPAASLTEAGITMLSNATNGTRESVAATEKAVKAVKDSIPALNDTVTSTSTTEAATARAVKLTYDLAAKAETPSGAQSKANAAETNAKSASLPRTGGSLTGPLDMGSNNIIGAPGASQYITKLVNHGGNSGVHLDTINNEFRFYWGGSFRLAIDSQGSLTRINASAVLITAGSGSPEGVISANAGSLYLRRDEGQTVLYVKQSGAGNVGWVAK